MPSSPVFNIAENYIKTYNEYRDHEEIDTSMDSSSIAESGEEEGSPFIQLNLGRGKKLNPTWFTHIKTEKVDRIPEDIDGVHVYKVRSELGTYSSHTDDRRHFVMQTSSKKNQLGQRRTWKNGWYAGSFFCPNKYSFFQSMKKRNETNFLRKASGKACFSCR